MSVFGYGGNNVHVRITGDKSDLDAKLAGARSGFANFRGAVTAIGVGLGARAFGEFVVDAGKAAAAAEAAANSAEDVLGPALGTLHDNLEDVRLQLGLSQGDLDQTIARFGLLTEGFGLADEAQAQFIEQLITTGGELAAFKGTLDDAPRAIDALGAALRGEFDPLEQFGVKIKQSEINQRALELQAADTTGELGDQEAQIAALWSLIEEKAGPAFGSLAEQQETLAAKTNAATARFEDLKTELGERFLPVLEDVSGWLLNAFEALDRLTNPATFDSTRLGKFINDMQAALQPIANLIDAIGKGLQAIENFEFDAGSPNRPGSMDDEDQRFRQDQISPDALKRIPRNYGGNTYNMTFQRVDGDNIDQDIYRGLLLADHARRAEIL